MTRNLKALGLALGAVLAFSATAVSSASAIDTFTATVSPVNVSGTGTNSKFELTSPVFKTECTTAAFSATGVTTGSSSITVTPTYTGQINETPHGTKCTATGGTATVNMNGCDYDLTGSTTGSDGGSADATISITCTKSAITIENSFGCTLEIAAQTPTSGGVTYTNESSGKVKITATSTGITYATIGNFACTIAGIPSEGNNFDYTGSVLVSPASGALSVSSS